MHPFSLSIKIQIPITSPRVKVDNAENSEITGVLGAAKGEITQKIHMFKEFLRLVSKLEPFPGIKL